MAATPTIDQAKLEAFMGQFVQDMGAAATAPLVVIGDKLGLYKAMADGEPVTPGGAGRAHRLPRALPARVALPAGGERLRRVRRGRASGSRPSRRSRSPTTTRPVFIPGAFQLLAAIVKDEPHITERFRSGEGMGWGEHDHDLFEGTERFFRPGYLANLVDAWLPSLDGVVEKLAGGRAGGRHRLRPRRLDDPDGAARSRGRRFVGSDYHEGSIEAARARRRARRRGRPRDVRGREREGLRRRPVRPRLRLRRAARHGRPGRRRAPRALAAGGRRDLDGRRAVRGRQRRGEPQPGRARVLRRLDDALHPELAQPGGRARRSAPRRARSGWPRCCTRAASAACGARPRRRSTWSWRCVRSARARRVSAGRRSPCRAGCRAGAPRPRGSRRGRRSACRRRVRRFEAPLEDEVAGEAGDRHAVALAAHRVRHREVGIAARVQREAVGPGRFDRSRRPPTTPGSATGRRAASRPPRPGRCWW